jgi:hypothetical protein
MSNEKEVYSNVVITTGRGQAYEAVVLGRLYIQGVDGFAIMPVDLHNFCLDHLLQNRTK